MRARVCVYIVKKKTKGERDVYVVAAISNVVRRIQIRIGGVLRINSSNFTTP